MNLELKGKENFNEILIVSCCGSTGKLCNGQITATISTSRWQDKTRIVGMHSCRGQLKFDNIKVIISNIHMIY